MKHWIILPHSALNILKLLFLKIRKHLKYSANRSMPQLFTAMFRLPLPMALNSGFGAEIGISTQKLHARGPMALEELTSYKWIVDGERANQAKIIKEK